MLFHHGCQRESVNLRATRGAKKPRRTADAHLHQRRVVAVPPGELRRPRVDHAGLDVSHQYSPMPPPRRHRSRGSTRSRTTSSSLSRAKTAGRKASRACTFSMTVRRSAARCKPIAYAHQAPLSLAGSLWRISSDDDQAPQHAAFAATAASRLSTHRSPPPPPAALLTHFRPPAAERVCGGQHRRGASQHGLPR